MTAPDPHPTEPLMKVVITGYYRVPAAAQAEAYGTTDPHQMAALDLSRFTDGHVAAEDVLAWLDNDPTWPTTVTIAAEPDWHSLVPAGTRPFYCGGGMTDIGSHHAPHARVGSTTDWCTGIPGTPRNLPASPDPKADR